MSPLTFAYLIIGLGCLGIGASVLVGGAARLAARLDVPALTIGLTVVAFGASSPGIAVSVRAALQGSGDLVIGNAVGGNIAILLLFLGLIALLSPPRVTHRLLSLDVPVMIAASLATYGLARDGELSLPDGALLLIGILAYTALRIVMGRKDGTAERAQHDLPPVTAGPYRGLIDLGAILMGLALLTAGSHLLIEGALGLGRSLGLSERVIGLTVIGAGTALPVFITSLFATLKGQPDVAVGNLVGSCIFNLLCVLGLSALLAPQPLSVSPNVLTFDFPVMLAAAVACLPLFFAGWRVSRWEGLVLLAYYGVYILYMALFATGRPQASPLADAVLNYALPLTAMALLWIAAWSWYRERGKAPR
ncbi:MAG: calcium/sodium antiporter [Pseudomonas sp.]|uniref:calcium/sodium antiporter n=1 Tax=Pseudomonas sp. TaxID=306 RepID=UPI003D132FE9